MNFLAYFERSSTNFAKKIQELAEDKAENKIRTVAYKKNQISKLSSSKLLSLSQTSLLQKLGRRYSPQGGFNPPPNRGRRAERLDPGLLVLPTPRPWTKLLAQLLSYPSLILPTGHRVDSMLCGALRRWRVLAPLGPKKWCSKRPSKNNQILMPFQPRFLNVLAPFWTAKMAPKSIKNG
mgnify:CR=1 FL=1